MIKLRKLLDMYNSISTARMALHLANGKTVRVSRQVFAIIDNEGSLERVIKRDEDMGVFPWIELQNRFGDVKISDFSTTDDKIIFWEGGAL